MGAPQLSNFLGVTRYSRKDLGFRIGYTTIKTVYVRSESVALSSQSFDLFLGSRKPRFRTLEFAYLLLEKQYIFFRIGAHFFYATAKLSEFLFPPFKFFLFPPLFLGFVRTLQFVPDPEPVLICEKG